MHGCFRREKTEDPDGPSGGRLGRVFASEIRSVEAAWRIKMGADRSAAASGRDAERGAALDLPGQVVSAVFHRLRTGCRPGRLAILLMLTPSPSRRSGGSSYEAPVVVSRSAAAPEMAGVALGAGSLTSR